MTEAVAVRKVGAETMEKVLLGGNLAVLSPEERMTYYGAVCESVGLNPLTRPFEYLNLNGKLVLYARREATEQLRKIHGVSIGKLEKTFHGDDLYIVEAPASDKTGRTDASTGAVNIKGLSGEAKANALMKCETKAKRRVTLSICGLGMLDETEVETIPGAIRVMPPEPGDDVPAVDVRGDVSRSLSPESLVEGEDALDLGALAAERAGGVSAPTPAPIAPPGAAQPPKTAIRPENVQFLRTMAEWKRRLWDDPSYYRILGGAGFEHSSEVLDRKTQKEVFGTLKLLVEQKEKRAEVKL
jgi:hypothetical protein